MLHANERFADAVEAAVALAEETTDAEIVVVAAPRAGDYRVQAVVVGVLCAWLTLVFLLFSPWSFHPSWIPLELPLVGVLMGTLAHRSDRLMRWLSRPTRRQAAVREAAAAAFHDEAVHCTRGRTGLLIFMATLEGRIELLPDVGLTAKVPGAAFNTVRWGAQADANSTTDLDHFVAGLQALGTVLSAHVPATDDNPNEISDRPRIRT